MPTLSVSEFSLIVVTSGKPKQTRVKSIANREPYAAFRDYYGPLRNSIKRLFIAKRHISHLYTICNRQEGTKKQKYEMIVNTFKDWQSGKNIKAFDPPREHYNFSQTSITCNPELHVVLNGQPRLVKLHFSSSDKMTQERANIICALMEESISDSGFEYSVLDLTSGKEYFFNGNYEKTYDRINNEIKELEKFWLEVA
ncbi:hypothetical protein [Vibrio parahaemolyticus]|uniref:hypothetical protein n=1 Tax=Vibrio parahaemolyticus TaxID=670 RepID=UPI0004A27EB7|nr:hypothetical protein [Vibrio parahaemolyticus]ELH3492511.1 hypothetical protein [Vibrio vulnificus]TOR08568.1 hypothetical protein CGG81_03940 [Vibrio parahaemolyticus]